MCRRAVLGNREKTNASYGTTVAGTIAPWRKQCEELNNYPMWQVLISLLSAPVEASEATITKTNDKHCVIFFWFWRAQWKAIQQESLPGNRSHQSAIIHCRGGGLSSRSASARRCVVVRKIRFWQCNQNDTNWRKRASDKTHLVIWLWALREWLVKVNSHFPWIFKSLSRSLWNHMPGMSHISVSVALKCESLVGLRNVYTEFTQSM